MADVPSSSDVEEGEILPNSVTLYHIIDEIGMPVSFSILPIQWDEGDPLQENGTNVYLHGIADGQKFHKRIIAWKFELSYLQPQVSVLSKDKNWITLHRPNKNLETVVRPILVTVHWLHSLKRDPEAPPESIWNNLLKAFSSYDEKPIKSDVSNHMLLLSEAAKRDKDLASSKYFVAVTENPTAFINEDTQKTKISNVIIDNQEEEDYLDYDDSDEDDIQMHSLFDPVCAICDNGGTVLCCEGRCLRSFHATKADGIESSCESLGYDDKSQYHAITSFLCRNCLYKRHQCYACGELGSSDVSSTQEVFPCFTANCGRFYHPKCVAKLLHADDETRAEELKDGIAMRKPFSCPLHKCFLCRIGEESNVHELQFALCRRCPKAYHRKCLPRNIRFEMDDDFNPPRAWTSILPFNRILIYCMDHAVIRELATPYRDHLIFPNFDGTSERLNSKAVSYVENKKELKISKIYVDDESILKNPRQVDSVTETKIIEKRCPTQDFNDSTGREHLRAKLASSSSQSLRNDKPSTNIRTALDKYKSSHKSGTLSSSRVEVCNSTYVLDAEEKKQLLALMEQAASSVKRESFPKSGNPVERTSMTLGMVEAHVHAVRTALQTLDNGGRKEDAEMFCDLDSLNRLIKLQKRLEIRLGPFLQGNRYTSFGRHFTKLEKLKEIVNRLHWYVQDGDTIVDFCCGSNDFSLLMKEKLEKTGKSCSFKNYDLFQPKNNFNFEKRDWMSVNVNELPNGSQLIMGLNPPFGFNASGANNFINKALEFKPKLIILIVPRETKRLDLKYPYDLIWEDDRIVAGKSFYLPGSLGVDNKQLEQWNIEAPPLYLWSRHDWTAKHSKVAKEHGHIHDAQRLDDLDGEENDMCIDMELESPNGCKNLGHHVENIPPGSL